MLKKIESLYGLLNAKFKFKVKESKLIVVPPVDIDESTENIAKKFISANKTFLIETLRNVKPNQEIIAFDIANCNEQKLSFAQERLRFIEKYEGGTNAYNVPLIYKLKQNVNLEYLVQSIHNLMNRHTILKTLIKDDNDANGYQTIDNHNLVDFDIPLIPLSTTQALRTCLNQDIEYMFNFNLEYPIRIKLYKLIHDNNTEVYLSMVVHHIAFDGWSVDILLSDLYGLYQQMANPSEAFAHVLPTLDIQYKDFAIWQKFYLNKTKLDPMLVYWKNELENYTPLNLLTDRPREQHINYQGDEAFFEVNDIISSKLRDLAKELHVSLYSVLLAGYYLMLYTYSNQRDIVIGTPVANRDHHQLENLIGFFINSLALRTIIKPNQLLVEYIKDVGYKVLQAQINQELPFEKLVEALGVEKDSSRHPIFQIMFSVQNFGQRVSQNDSFLEQYHDYDYKVAKFDITTMIDDSGASLHGVFNYAVSLFDKATITEYIKAYTLILEQLSTLTDSNNKNKLVCDTRYISNEQLNQIAAISKLNLSDHNSLVEMIDVQTSKTPSNIAIIDVKTDIKYKYSQLKSDYTSLAKYVLLHSNNKHTKLIGVLSEKGYNQVVSILSIMKSGFGYLPLNVEWPINRLDEILIQGQVDTILVSREQYEYIITVGGLHDKYTLWVIEEILFKLTTDSNIKDQIDNITLPQLYAENIAYVIFTSGSTGKPKGVTINHAGVMNTINAINQEFNVTQDDSVFALSELSFDLSVYDIFGLLAVGGKVIFPDQSKTKDLSHWVNQISKHAITIWNSVPQLAGLLIEELQQHKNQPLNTIRLFLLSGDWVPIQLTQQLKTHCNNARIMSLGGATEGSIWSIWYEVNTIKKTWKSIPYGFAMPNQRIYILNQDGNICPPGALGEICISGLGVAVGYWNDQEKTAKSFINYPTLGKVYRTGDLGKQNIEGYIEFLGRADNQVKINGYRIELEEISSKIANISNIDDVITVVRYNNKVPVLVSYYTGEQFSDNIFKEKLMHSLPEYMIPNVFIYMKQFPLTANGKLDLKILPEPSFISSHQYIAPRTSLERNIGKVWAEVLRINENQVSINDDFFKNGGDSILSIQLVGRLKRLLGLSIGIKDIFNHRTIEKLSSKLEMVENDTISNDGFEQGFLFGEFNLLPIQKWFFTNKFINQNYWNQAFTVLVPLLDIDRLSNSLQQLFEFHDVFRLRYKVNSKSSSMNEYTQFYANDVKKIEQVKILNINDLVHKEYSSEFKQELNNVLTKWQSGFNITTGTLYNIGYTYGYQDGLARLHFSFHHLIIDTVSWRLLVEDLRDIYTGNTLGNKGSSYRQWIMAIENYGRKNYIEEQKYWKLILDGYGLPTFVNQNNVAIKSNVTQFQLSKAQTHALLYDCNQAYNTQINDLLLTALALSLRDLTNEHTNYITLEGHGREFIGPWIDITRTVGWFTTMYPVKLSLSKQNDVGIHIRNIKEMLRNIPNAGLGYGVVIGYTNQPLPKISFNYLGQIGSNTPLCNTKESLITTNQALWSIVGENAGDTSDIQNRDDNILNINAIVLNNHFEVSIVSQLNPSQTSKFCDDFQRNLILVIEHCSQKNSTSYTISDFTEFEPYVALNTNGSKTPIFFFPPSEGGAESFLGNICQSIDKDIPLYLFNNYFSYLTNNLSAAKLDQMSIEEIATNYIYIIKKVQPTGPYNLFGWSFGGVVGYEIVHQLTRHGDVVNNLMLLDSVIGYKYVLNGCASLKDSQFHQENINWKYNPDVINNNTNIILFKASHYIDTSKCTDDLIAHLHPDMISLLNHVADNEQFNGLDKIAVDINQVTIKPFSATHLDWHLYPAIVKEIANEITRTISI